jgi:hypothetical protein
LEEVEEKERLDELGDEGGKTKGAKSGKLAISNKKKINLVSDSLPSPAARRIIPKIDAEMVKKEEKLIAAKGKRIERKVYFIIKVNYWLNLPFHLVKQF